MFYLSDRRAPEAEPHFKALAADSPDGTLALADFYTGLGRRDEALAVLNGITDKKAQREAKLRIATIQYESGKTEDALKLTDALISEKPRNPDGHILKARLLLASHGDLDEAARQAQAAVHADTGSTAAQYTAGLVAIARKDFEGAERAFLESAKLNPRAAAPQLQLARLRLARGDSAGALSAAEEAAEARPDDIEAAVLMVRSLRAQGQLDRARRELADRLNHRADHLRHRRLRPLRPRRRPQRLHRAGAARPGRSRVRRTTSSPTRGIGKLLTERGVLYAPDYVIDAGGVIQVADEIKGFNFDRAKLQASGIFETARRILQRAEAEGVSPAAAADRLAERRGWRRSAAAHHPASAEHEPAPASAGRVGSGRVGSGRVGSGRRILSRFELFRALAPLIVGCR